METLIAPARTKTRVGVGLFLGGVLLASGFAFANLKEDQKIHLFEGGSVTEQQEIGKKEEKGETVVDQLLKDIEGKDSQSNEVFLEGGKDKLLFESVQEKQESGIPSLESRSLTDEEKGTVGVVMSGPSLPDSFSETCVNGGDLYPVDPNATYLILTRSMFVDALRPFISAKRVAGETVSTILVESIVCHEPGVDVQAKIRHYLSRVAEQQVFRKDLTKVLIVGAPRKPANHLDTTLVRIGQKLTTDWEIPMRYVRGLSGFEAIPTDQYYASLNESWNTDLDDLGVTQWSVVHDWQTDFDFSYQFIVGRVPVRTTTDLVNWIDKTLHWVTPTGAFKESYFATGACPSHVEDSRVTWESDSTHLILQHVCQHDNGGDITSYANRELPDLISSYSHGNVRGIIREPLPIGYTLAADSPGFTKAPILFIHGCEVGGVDYLDTSLAESYIARRDGVVAFIGSTRSHYDDVFPFQGQVFNHGDTMLGRAFYEAKMRNVRERYLPLHAIDNMFMYSLYGDPGLQIVQPSVRIRASSDVAHVPAMLFGEPVSMPVRMTSYASRSLVGNLRHNNLETEEVSLSAHSTINTVLHTNSPQMIIVPRVDAYLPSEKKAIRFFSSRSTACDTRIMTCVSSAISIVPPIELGCARLSKTFDFVDGVRQQVGKKANIKILSSSLTSTPLTFVLTVYPGEYLENMPGVDQLSRRTGTEVSRIRVGNPEIQHVYQFVFNRTPVSAPYTGERSGSYYAAPLFKVMAYDDDGVAKGWCEYNSGAEPDIEGALPNG